MSVKHLGSHPALLHTHEGWHYPSPYSNGSAVNSAGVSWEGRHTDVLVSMYEASAIAPNALDHSVTTALNAIKNFALRATSASRDARCAVSVPNYSKSLAVAARAAPITSVRERSTSTTSTVAPVANRAERPSMKSENTPSDFSSSALTAIRKSITPSSSRSIESSGKVFIHLRRKL